jgi:hypothetical protein
MSGGEAGDRGAGWIDGESKGGRRRRPFYGNGKGKRGRPSYRWGHPYAGRPACCCGYWWAYWGWGWGWHWGCGCR